MEAASWQPALLHRCAFVSFVEWSITLCCFTFDVAVRLQSKSQKDLKQVISPAKKPSKAGTPYLTDVWFPRCALDSGQHSCSAYSVGSKRVLLCAKGLWERSHLS